MGNSKSQLSVPAPKKIIYFGVKAAGLPATMCLEVAGLPYEAQKVAMEEWKDLKPTTPTGVLPIAEFADGTKLPESGAIQRACAAAGGLLGTGKDYMISEMLMGLTADFSKKVMGNVPTIMTVGDWTAEKTAKFNDEIKDDVLAFLKKYDQYLSGDKFTESGVTLGEIELFCKLVMFKNAIPEVATGGLKPFFDRMAEVPGIKKTLAGESQFGELIDYIVAFP